MFIWIEMELKDCILWDYFSVDAGTDLGMRFEKKIENLMFSDCNVMPNTNWSVDCCLFF